MSSGAAGLTACALRSRVRVEKGPAKIVEEAFEKRDLVLLDLVQVLAETQLLRKVRSM